MPLACPHCKHPLTLPQPTPEKMACPHCAAMLRFSTARATVPAGAAASSGVASTATAAKLVAGYELQRELARGGLGVVYLAYHPHLKHYRAIKRPQPRADIDNDVLLGRFRREMEALGALDNKHIIRVYDAGSDGDGPYMVTEYLDGESISNLLTRHHQLPIAEACELVRQAALGLQAAHECGLVHRDIKPSNLMLARAAGGTARTLVIDWGLVKRSGEADAPGHRLTTIRTELGTPDYIAPEQIRDAHAVDIRADIYSLGVTLYCLLAGQPPFQGRTDDQKLMGHTKEPFPPIARKDIPKPLMDALVKMVRKNPAERYQTPAEVVAASQPFACAEPHRMLALLAPIAPGQAGADTNRILDEKTQIAPPPSTAPVATSGAPFAGGRRSRRLLLILAAAGVAVVLLTCALPAMLIVGLMLGKPNDGTKKDDGQAKADRAIAANTKKENLSPVLIDEDFHTGVERGLPDGWTGDGLRVVSANGRFALEPSKPAPGSAKTLLRRPLKGDFAIEARYYLGPSGLAALSVLLEDDGRSKAVLPVIFHFTGEIDMAKERYNPVPGFVRHQPAHFLLKREGTKLFIYVDAKVVGTKDLSIAPEYDTLTVGVNPYSALNWLKVTSAK